MAFKDCALHLGSLAIRYLAFMHASLSALVRNVCTGCADHLNRWTDNRDARALAMSHVSYLEGRMPPITSVTRRTRAIVHAQVTVTSTLSDAVVHGCTALDVLDR
jgi:hypothetical protein